MAEAANILRLDGTDHDLARASDEARRLVSKLQAVESVLKEKASLLAVLNRAKNAYIADLKTEIIKTKTGVDLAALFDPE